MSRRMWKEKKRRKPHPLLRRNGSHKRNYSHNEFYEDSRSDVKGEISRCKSRLHSLRIKKWNCEEWIKTANETLFRIRREIRYTEQDISKCRKELKELNSSSPTTKTVTLGAVTAGFGAGTVVLGFTGATLLGPIGIVATLAVTGTLTAGLGTMAVQSGMQCVADMDEERRTKLEMEELEACLPKLRNLAARYASKCHKLKMKKLEIRRKTNFLKRALGLIKYNGIQTL